MGSNQSSHSSCSPSLSSPFITNLTRNQKYRYFILFDSMFQIWEVLSNSTEVPILSKLVLLIFYISHQFQQGVCFWISLCCYELRVSMLPLRCHCLDKIGLFIVTIAEDEFIFGLPLGGWGYVGIDATNDALRNCSLRYLSLSLLFEVQLMCSKFIALNFDFSYRYLYKYNFQANEWGLNRGISTLFI